jgi:hypothetical protein
MLTPPNSPRAIATPSLYKPSVERHERIKRYYQPVSELILSLHKQYRNLSSESLDIGKLKKEVEALKRSSFPKKSYWVLINAIEKLMHAYHQVGEGSEGIGARGYHLEHLWIDLKKDIEGLRRTAEISVLSQPEKRIVEQFLDIEKWLETYRTREKEKVDRCKGHESRDECWYDDLCVWSTDLWHKACRLKGSTLSENVKACKSLRNERECTQKEREGCMWENKKCTFKALKDSRTTEIQANGAGERHIRGCEERKSLSDCTADCVWRDDRCVSEKQLRETEIFAMDAGEETKKRRWPWTRG